MKTITITEESTVREVLQAQVDGFTALGHENATIIPAFILKYGREFKPQPLPKEFKRGPIKMCYNNAANLTLWRPNEPEKYIYCEGYAAGIIPVPHAWVIDFDGNVIDNTWADPEHSQYFGVPFALRFARRNILKTGALIDNWRDDYKLVRGLVEETEFLHANFRQ